MHSRVRPFASKYPGTGFFGCAIPVSLTHASKIDAGRLSTRCRSATMLRFESADLSLGSTPMGLALTLLSGVAWTWFTPSRFGSASSSERTPSQRSHLP
jgi:hypothetical protein